MQVIETAGAGDIHQHAFHFCPLADGHLGLRHRPLACYFTGEATVEVNDAHTVVETFATGSDEVGARSLEPGGTHEAVRVPATGKAFPVAGITEDSPVINQFADLGLVVGTLH